MIVNGVKVTFLYYPFKINEFKKFDEYIQVPDLLNLAAMKAYTIGRRPKWKDYVDLYFITKEYFPIEKISKKAKEIFGDVYNDKLFREQLCYYDDIDYSETVDYVGKSIKKDKIKKHLTDIATKI